MNDEFNNDGTSNSPTSDDDKSHLLDSEYPSQLKDENFGTDNRNSSLSSGSSGSGNKKTTILKRFDTTNEGSGRSNSSDFTQAKFETEMLDLHNNRRSLHQNTGPLEWNATVAASVQEYANMYTCDGGLVHSQNSNYGENLAVGHDNKDTIEAWYDREICSYSYSNPVYGHNTGYFTQMVWKATTHVGCARINCGGNTGQFTICQYYPPGNMKGEFIENVMPIN